jgi:gluconate 2-dehydrogenase gamma chain
VLRAAGALGGTALLGLGTPALSALAGAASRAHETDAAFTTLGAGEARDFAAIAARIIPTTDTPGATEAGVVHFFDQAFSDAMRDALPAARDGLHALNTGLPDGGFASLPEAQQDASLAAIDGQPFFELMRLMTLFGYFAMSRYGGNREHAGWKLIGFDGHHGAWRPPFGFYDAEAQGADRDD